MEIQAIYMAIHFCEEIYLFPSGIILFLPEELILICLGVQVWWQFSQLLIFGVFILPLILKRYVCWV